MESKRENGEREERVVNSKIFLYPRLLSIFILTFFFIFYYYLYFNFYFKLILTGHHGA